MGQKVTEEYTIIMRRIQTKSRTSAVIGHRVSKSQNNSRDGEEAAQLVTLAVVAVQIDNTPT